MKEKFMQNKQLAYCGLLLFFLLFSNKGFSIDYYMRATGTNGNWAATTATTYYPAIASGTAYPIGTTPTSADNVYIVVNSATAVTFTINIENAVCNNLYVVSNTLTTATNLNIRFGESNTAFTRSLTVNGNFDIKSYYGTGGTVGASILAGALVRTVNMYRNGANVTSSVTINNNLIIGAATGLTTGTSVRSNILNIGTYTGSTNLLNAPNFTIGGNVNIYNQIDTTSRVNASKLNLNNGTMTLTGDVLTTDSTGSTGKGYIYTYVNAAGLSTDNKFYITDNSANLILKHRNDCPFLGITSGNYSQIVPSLDFGTVRYESAVTPIVKSLVLNVNHHDIVLNNNAEISTVGSANLKIGNQLTVESGTFTVPGIVDMISDTGSSSIVTIKGGKIVASGSGYLNFTNPTNIEYAVNATETGIELPNAMSANKLDVLTLSNTTGASFTFNVNPTANTINLRKSNFTLSSTTLTGNTLISLEGANAIYDCNLSTSLLNIKNSCTFAKNQTIYTENSSNNTTTGAINIGGGAGVTDYNILLTNNSVIKTSDLTISGNTILDAASTGKFNVYRYVAMPNLASRNLTSNGILVLKSNNFQTARVDVGTNNGNPRGRIIGDVTVERYLQNSNRRWRLLTAPVVSATNNTIWKNWQNDGNIINSGVVSGLPVNGYGTDAWGPDPSYTIADNGMYYLDPPTGTQTAASSTHNFRKWGLFYDTTAGTDIMKFGSVTNTKTELMNDGTINNAFLAFIIKPFGYGVTVTNGIANQVLGSTSTTLAAKGSLIYDTQNYAMTTDVFSLIANPYASSINFSDMLDLNGEINGNSAIYSKLWFLDPNIGKGGYVNYDELLGWSNLNARHAANSGIIQSGEGFFVMGGPSGEPLSINESMKTSTSTAFIFGRSINTTPNVQKLRVNIEKDVDGSLTNIDACVVGFYEGGSNAVNQKDVQKLTNPAESISFLTGTTRLSSEHRAPIVNGDELFVRLTSAVAGTNYTLKINTENFNLNGSAIFYDLKLGTQTTLPLDGSVFVYPFTVTSDATTQGTRFKIVFTTSILSSEDISNPFGINVYPNPASKADGLTINLGKLEIGDYTYRILNMLGQEIQNGSIACEELNQEYKVNLTNAVNSGLYTVELLDQNKSIYTTKIIIK